MLGRIRRRKAFRCEYTKKKCIICGKDMETKVKSKHGYGGMLAKNRVTCSDECSRINMIEKARAYAKKYQKRKRQERKEKHLNNIKK